MSSTQTQKIPAPQAAGKPEPTPNAERKSSQETKILTYAQVQKLMPAGLKYALAASLV